MLLLVEQLFFNSNDDEMFLFPRRDKRSQDDFLGLLMRVGETVHDGSSTRGIDLLSKRVNEECMMVDLASSQRFMHERM